MGFRVGEFLDVRAACRLEEFRLSLPGDSEPAFTGTPHGAIPQTPQTVAAGFWGGADAFGDFHFHLWYSSQNRGHSASHSNHEAVNGAGALKIKTVTPQARTADVRAAKDRDTEHTLSAGAYGANPQTPQPASADFWAGANGLGTLTPGLRLRAKSIRAH